MYLGTTYMYFAYTPPVPHQYYYIVEYPLLKWKDGNDEEAQNNSYASDISMLKIHISQTFIPTHAVT